MKNRLCAVYVDMGTTNTRVWMAQGENILAWAQASVGIRDTARSGSSAQIRRALRDLMAQVRSDAQERSVAEEPRFVAAAGMITSPLGLAEVPHVAAPAGLIELAAAVERRAFPDITSLPVLLVPGVRVGPSPSKAESIGDTDVMRGEETLCVGLHALGLLKTEATLLNLGSHWKTIRLDAQGRIAASVTSMAGELIHVAQTQTILASSVPHERPQKIYEPWLRAGMQEQRRSGLARALFCVRLLEQRSHATPEERLSFLVGAFIAADLDPLLAKGELSARAPVVITGGGSLGIAWQQALAQAAVEAGVLDAIDVERGLLKGLEMITAGIAKSL